MFVSNVCWEEQVDKKYSDILVRALVYEHLNYVS